MITSTDRRGAEIFAVDLGDELTALGHEVQTVALAAGQTSPRLELPALGPSPLSATTLRALRAAARGAEVVIAHGSRNLPACAIALTGSTRFVYRNIGDPTQWSATMFRHARTRLFLTRAAAVVALTQTAATVLHDSYGVPLAKLEVIPTGVPTSRHRPAEEATHRAARATLGVPADVPVVAIVGALSEEKNVALAIDAISSLGDVHLLVAGDGPQRRALEVQAATVAPARVHFTGVLADPAPAFAASDAVLVTSRTEGLPAVLIEAGMRGLPVVTTDVGYVRDIVVDGETGAVVPVDDAAAISAAIAKILAGAPAIGERGRRRCESMFAMREVAERWSTLLQQVARPRTTR